MGIPSAKGKHWLPETLKRIVSNPILYGEVYANRYKQVARRKSKNGKQVSVEVMRPCEEWVRLPDAPAVISKETFDRIQSQIKSNKAESIRNNKQENVGLLRAGYIFCGVCGNAMHVAPPSKAERGFIHRYCCRRDAGGNLGIEYNHRTQISIKLIETEAKAKIVEMLLRPELVGAKVEEIRDELKPTFDTTDLEETIVNVVSAVSRFAEQTWIQTVRVAPLPAAFLASLPHSRKLGDQVVSLRAYGLGRTPFGPTLAPPPCACVLTCTRA
jgi:site-specific DNA recombinase